MSARPNLASAAFRLAMRGLHVFPLAPGTRIPMKGSHGYLDATRDVDVVRAWWLASPTANIGIATGRASGVWVLDVDPRHGGAAALAELESEHGLLPATITATTPRGGRHLYWRWPTGTCGPEIRNSVARVGDGLDVLGEGGSVVAPPSVRALGGRYAWCNGAAALADAPGWLVELTRAPVPTPRANPSSHQFQGADHADRYVAAAITDELRQLADAGEGQRNDQLNRSAFAVASFVGAGAVAEDWARSKLEDAAREIGLPVIEARRTIASAFAAGLQHPRELPS